MKTPDPVIRNNVKYPEKDEREVVFKLERLKVILPMSYNIDKFFKLDGYDTETFRKNGEKVVVILPKD